MSDKICVIVGAGSGISLAVAKRFANEGFQIVLVARRADALETYMAELHQTGASGRSFVADAGDVTSLRQAFDQIRAQIGEPGVLVYNAAALVQGPPSTIDGESMVRDFKVNVVGAVVAAQQVIPSMRARRSGTILFTGGGLALNPMPQYASLALGKAALRNLVYSLGAELEPDGIHVATVTIAGFIKPGTHFAPELIAEVYWKLHRQEPGLWEREIVYQ